MLHVNPKDSAIVITDPQNDFLSPGGAGYHLTKEMIEYNNTVVNLEKLLRAAKHYGYLVFISPHYLYPHDRKWRNMSPIEEEMLVNLKVYTKESQFVWPPFGADFVDVLKPYILDGKTIIASPHKVTGPQSNDLAFQLTKRGINKVILAGIMSNLCVESHLRDLVERGFQAAVVHDATAAPGMEAYNAAMVNYKYFASAVWNTVQGINALKNGLR